LSDIFGVFINLENLSIIRFTIEIFIILHVSAHFSDLLTISFENPVKISDLSAFHTEVKLMSILKSELITIIVRWNSFFFGFIESFSMQILQH